MNDIQIKGAKMHNLKNIDIDIPRRKLVVVTGLSGSGKSSLAFDTLYAEGQRRYVESLSSYARQFLGKLDKPLVDHIHGIAPAIAIEQKVNTNNPRSTVGTSTEIYDYLKLLFARIGKTYSPISGELVTKDSVSSVIDFIKTIPLKSKCLILAPIRISKDRDADKVLKMLEQQGFARIQTQHKTVRISTLKSAPNEPFELVVDRVVVNEGDDFYNRLSDSVETAFFEGDGYLTIQLLESEKRISFNNKFERDGLLFTEPNEHLFSFNNPLGACPSCEGYGDTIGIDPELVIPNTELSVFEGAIAPWKGDRVSKYKKDLVKSCHHFDFPIHKPYFKLSIAQKDLIWKGNRYFKGLNYFFEKLEAKNYKIQNRVMLSRYRGRTTCSRCKGMRLRSEANYVQIGTKTISELAAMPISDLKLFFDQLSLSNHDYKIGHRLLTEIKNRIEFLCDVGLSYLTINRKSNTLSGGESQRINLATSLGSSLVGSLYILDEPSIGLHPRDTQKLIKVLKSLQNLGNSVIVVEHDEDIIRAADQVIDIGPEAGVFGGEVVFQGTFNQLVRSDSLTGNYISNRVRIEIPQKRRKVTNKLELIGAREHNLKNINVMFPLNMLTVITGVSGSGKSTLLKKIIYPALQREKKVYGEKSGQFSDLKGDLRAFDSVEFVSQNPIGVSSRSNPVTYVKAYDEIRKLFAHQKISKLRGYQAKHFSFNVDGGRCEVCKGEGTVKIEMQFMADVHLSCEQCHKKRFKKEILEVTFHNKNIFDVLSMSIDEAISFFDQYHQKKITTRLQPLQDVGMGYVALGQSSSTLSGGEAQRIKLASFLLKGAQKEKSLFIFDEPTTGLHFHDVKKLVGAFQALIEKGHSIFVIEHNISLIEQADYVIDLGPEGGINGGQLLAYGTPEEVALNKNSSLHPFLFKKEFMK